ncbi:hypothetical protein K402DRAFT_394912 [Aulographum hederae CBS 113979]|uniref:Uncharacterized protein n=1 Tax=Aulographum hederae CBS 113979 TaxID=1176131 RepID=A0A6G1GW78_9PEZI|nr:hypothetical protein K402DRAFT_394912 [Aulographum hederae CBS 113979]
MNAIKKILGKDHKDDSMKGNASDGIADPPSSEYGTPHGTSGASGNNHHLNNTSNDSSSHPMRDSGIGSSAATSGLASQKDGTGYSSSETTANSTDQSYAAEADRAFGLDRSPAGTGAGTGGMTSSLHPTTGTSDGMSTASIKSGIRGRGQSKDFSSQGLGAENGSGYRDHPGNLGGATAAAAGVGAVDYAAKHEHGGRGHEFRGDPCESGDVEPAPGPHFVDGPHRTDTANYYDPDVAGGVGSRSGPTSSGLGSQPHETGTSRFHENTSMHGAGEADPNSNSHLYGRDAAVAGGAGYAAHEFPNSTTHHANPTPQSIDPSYTSPGGDPTMGGGSAPAPLQHPVLGGGENDYDSVSHPQSHPHPTGAGANGQAAGSADAHPTRTLSKSNKEHNRLHKDPPEKWVKEHGGLPGQ